MKKNIIKPSKDFIENLRKLTDGNEHGKCYREVAAWACIHATENYKPWFAMFHDIFNAMVLTHEEVGNFPYCELRYEIGKELDELIEKVFGAATLNAINEGR